MASLIWAALLGTALVPLPLADREAQASLFLEPIRAEAPEDTPTKPDPEPQQLAYAEPIPLPPGTRLRADLIQVDKSERRLSLLKDGRIIRSYPIVLGSRPEGHKERRGDGRTPEGRYYIDWRSSSAQFYKSMHISYPSTADRAAAQEKGVDPGGMIMIHGQPRPGKHRELQDAIRGDDWTQGCIAVDNSHIDEIWRLTESGVPIEITP